MKHNRLFWFAASLFSIFALNSAQADIYNYAFTNGVTSLTFQLDSSNATDLGGFIEPTVVSSGQPQVVAFFSAELGLGGGFELLDENSQLLSDSTGQFSYTGPVLYDPTTYALATGTFSFTGFFPDPGIQTATLVVTDISPAVPELSTWAMMILGFAGVGFMAYRRRNQSVALAAP